MGRVPSEPYQNLREEKEYFRDTLTDIIEEEYSLVDKNRQGSIEVQSKICNRFLIEVTPERIDAYCKAYDDVLLKREIKLGQHVNDLVTQITNWEKYDTKSKTSIKYSKDLGEKHYLKVITKLRDTDTVREIMVPVNEYLSEKEIDRRIKDDNYYGAQNDKIYNDTLLQHEKEIAEIKKRRLSKTDDEAIIKYEKEIEEILQRKPSKSDNATIIKYQKRVIKIKKGGLSESELEEAIKAKNKDKPRIYLPLFSDMDPSVDYSKLEILAVANVTVLYNKSKFTDRLYEDIPFQELVESKAIKYAIYSRIKRSIREVEKLADELLQLRAEDDTPYDNIGAIVQVSNGDEMYTILNHLIDTSSTYPEIDNTKCKKNNEKKTKTGNIVLKFRDDNYATINGKVYRVCDQDNLKDVLEQITKTEISVDRNIREKSRTGILEKYILTEDEIEQEKQGIKAGHTLDNFKCETWIMLPKMLETYFGRHIGHGEDYFRRRKLNLETYRENPAESPAHKDAIEAKASKTEGRRLSEDQNKTQEVLPSVTLIGHFLEMLFIPAYQPTEYKEYI